MEREPHMSPQTTAYYRARAEECERLAAMATDPQSREIMTDLAQRWRGLITLDETRKTRRKPPIPDKEPT